MKQPVWTLHLTRDTNAPLAVVLAPLEDGPGWARWHPARRAGVPEVTQDGEQRSFRVCHPWRLGVLEEECFTVRPEGERVILDYTARFKGWPVLALMGWWRFQRRRLWEGFVDTLR